MLTRFSLADILVLAGTAAAGRMAPPASTSIPARLECVQGHVSRVHVAQAELGVKDGAKMMMVRHACAVPGRDNTSISALSEWGLTLVSGRCRPYSE